MLRYGFWQTYRYRAPAQHWSNVPNQSDYQHLETPAYEQISVVCHVLLQVVACPT